MSTILSPLTDIQGIIVSGYGHLSDSIYFFLKIEQADLSKRWLQQIADKTTSAQWDMDANGRVIKPQPGINVAFTWAGLQAIGLSETALTSFPQEFREGIAEASRSRRLGDVGPSSPANWEIGGVDNNYQTQHEIHVLLIVQAPSEEQLTKYSDKIRQDFLAHGLSASCPAERGCRRENDQEHFGFKDSISQPEIEGGPKPTDDAHQYIKAGEFILGYPNSYNLLPATPTVPVEDDIEGNLKPIEHAGDNAQRLDLGRNGTYLVFRKLHQDVAGFRRFLTDRFPERQTKIAAKIVGRWQSGAPLTLTPEQDNAAFAAAPKNNDFSYAEIDPKGYRCPIGSHIRRTNPRDAFRGTPEESLTSVNRHRIIRRGASYGDVLPEGVLIDDKKPRGLLFLCINADIKRQFEFLQQSWINNPKFLGLYNDPDPLIGSRYAPNVLDPIPSQMTIQQDPVRERIHDLPSFVSVHGGAYFFLPSISALYFLAGVKKPNKLH